MTKLRGSAARILPSSSSSAKLAKYYNSSDTILFKKSDQLYGIDHARADAIKAGYLAVVEGYTDVLMAHQMGVSNVVATMGTALNDRHVLPAHGMWVQKGQYLLFDADLTAARPASIGPPGGFRRARNLELADRPICPTDSRYAICWCSRDRGAAAEGPGRGRGCVRLQAGNRFGSSRRGAVDAQVGEGVEQMLRRSWP